MARKATVLAFIVLGVASVALLGGWRYAPTGADVILGRPTNTSVTLSVRWNSDTTGAVAYGTQPPTLSSRTATTSFDALEPREILLRGLTPNTRYYYRLLGPSADTTPVQGTFVTQRAPGRRFTFEVQSDSHPEGQQLNAPPLYAQTLLSAAADVPDFYLSLGDDFSVDSLSVVTSETVRQRYELQRSYLGLVARTSPLFLVGGNHEQAAACNLDGTPDNVAVWAQRARNLFYPQPAPDDFYSGDTVSMPFIGLLRDFYAWTWGDALFVVIDPYWHSPVPVDNRFGGGPSTPDKWQITIGDDQYRWLKRTLESSTAKYKFVFAHHIPGTTGGGADQAGLYEWGGKDQSGVYRFAEKRPGWEMPIHQLMVQNKVTVFFQGHRHVFARQELDGVVYQSLPEPADPTYALSNSGGYTFGTLVQNSGRVRVTVSRAKVLVEYVRSYLTTDTTAERPEEYVAFSYTVPAAPTLSNPVAQSLMSRDTTYMVYATLRPSHIAGSFPVRIYTYRLVGKRWKAFGYVKAIASSYASRNYSMCFASVKLTGKGRWRLRSYAPGDAICTPKWSSGYAYVTVK